MAWAVTRSADSLCLSLPAALLCSVLASVPLPYKPVLSRAADQGPAGFGCFGRSRMRFIEKCRIQILILRKGRILIRSEHPDTIFLLVFIDQSWNTVLLIILSIIWNEVGSGSGSFFSVGCGPSFSLRSDPDPFFLDGWIQIRLNCTRIRNPGCWANKQYKQCPDCLHGQQHLVSRASRHHLRHYRK